MNIYIISKIDFNKSRDIFEGSAFHNEHSETEIAFKFAFPKYVKYIKDSLNKANIEWKKLA